MSKRELLTEWARLMQRIRRRQDSLRREQRVRRQMEPLVLAAINGAKRSAK